MSRLPDREQQILRTHAVLIHQVVKACQNLEARTQLEPMLQVAEDRGWQALVATIRRVLSGRRDDALLEGLDEEDTVIVRGILLGLQNPASLPALQQHHDPTLAAPGLAQVIHAARQGDPQALAALADMAEQMIRVPGDMQRLGATLRRLLQGEQDPELLCKGMGPSGEQLVLDLLQELAKLSHQ